MAPQQSPDPEVTRLVAEIAALRAQEKALKAELLALLKKQGLPRTGKR